MVDAGRSQSGGDRHEYYYLFDYLRIVLAVGVFVGHLGLPSIPEALGNACVQVFFALSGFLIGGIILSSTPADLPRFYFNRCTRIWVPYAIAIALLFAGTALRQDLHDRKLWEFFFYKATFVYNFFGPPQLETFRDRMPLQGTGNHFWSICVEEQFYLVAPFLLLFARRLAVPLLLAVIVSNLFSSHAFASVAYGVLLALSRHRFGTWYLTPKGTRACVIVLVLVALVLWWRPDLYMMVIGPAAVALVALTARPGAAQPLGITLGGMSYPFYLNHWIGLFLRKQMSRTFHVGPAIADLAALAIALGLSFAHYRVIDRAIHDRRRSWFAPQRGVIACAAAYLLIVVGMVGGIALR
jgi:peptidoglycan/LPS O-acetylase OafA/YrhL